MRQPLPNTYRDVIKNLFEGERHTTSNNQGIDLEGL